MSDDATSSLSTFTQNGIQITLNTSYEVGQHVDDTYYVIANGSGNVTFSSFAITAGTETFPGNYVMVDPADPTKQAFDNRATAVNSYDTSVGHTLPYTVNVTGTTAKTVWFYRGLDTPGGGGENSSCFCIVEVTVYPSNPQLYPIKPTGFFVTGGKPCYNRSDINFSLFSQVTLTSNQLADEPDWTATNGYLRWPLKHFGGTVRSGWISPQMTQSVFNNGFQGDRIARLVFGALSNSASRQTLIERIVRDGLDIHGAVGIGDNAHIANGGFGVGRKILRYLSGKWLGNSAMLGIPSTIEYVATGFQVPYFCEDTIFAGATRALYGTTNNFFFPDSTRYTANHDVGDVRDGTGVREPHWVIFRSGTAQGGGSTTITLAAGTTTGIGVDDRVYITGGTGSGQLKIITNWDQTTKIATVTSAWSVNPNATSTYEVYNGGGYQADVTRGGMVQAAIALKLIGLNDDTATWPDRYMEYCQRWIDDDGFYTPAGRYPTTFPWVEDTSDERKWIDATNWTKGFYAASGVVWPTGGTGPSIAVDSGSFTFSGMAAALTKRAAMVLRLRYRKF